jgi:hypothetical protein
MFTGPTHACCDNCDGIPVDLGNWNNEELRPSTPEMQHSNTSTPHSTPSKSADENGKRKLTQKAPSSSRRKELFKEAQNAIRTWRFRTKQTRYSPSPITAAALLPDPIIDILARRGARDIVTIEDIQSKTRWIFAERHGEEVLQVMRRVDLADRARKKAKMDAKKAATAARKAVEKREKEKAKQEKEMACVKQTQKDKEAKKARAAQLAREKAEKQAAKEASARQKRPKASQPLGCLTFNLGPVRPSTSTPVAGPSSTPFATPTGVLLDFHVCFPFLV